MMTTRKFEPAEMIRGTATEAQHVAVEAIPKANATEARVAGGEFQRQRPVTRARHVLAQLLLVGREDSDAASAAGYGHIPLLRVRRGFDCRVGEQDVIHRLAL